MGSLNVIHGGKKLHLNFLDNILQVNLLMDLLLEYSLTLISHFNTHFLISLSIYNCQ